MPNRSPDPGQEELSGPAVTQTSPESLACNGCRKAKLRCSRDRPACLHCRRTGLECVYETKRVKPGMKAGAVEHLHRRLDALEKFVHERETAPATLSNNATIHPAEAQESAANQVLALLATELPKLIGASTGRTSSSSTEQIERSSKRRRFEDDNANWANSHGDGSPILPDPDSLETIISAYFSHLHPWIPMIHQARFRGRLDNHNQYDSLLVLLHAMVFATAKFVHDISFSRTELQNTRRWVIWNAMDHISLESLQALVIVAYTDIGDGNTAKAWSIIGSLTRTVEYSQLTQENEDKDVHLFCQPYTFLHHTEDWTEKEERRRVFWNVFNLDRFCSVTMGWNTSLTSDDVHRRLPCDGHLWRKCSPVTTPYFGIWDKSAARIGNPIAFLPHYTSPGQPTEPEVGSATEITSPDSPAQNLMHDMSTVGAFAYCIEATESLSRITSYFLQQRINISDQRDINSWLTRFKELDLRLVHWKMLLPQKWKTNMERQSTLMDPNLTTAHVTHNASMIILHQLIAYPPVEWNFRSRLPSAWSADACLSAGTEIAKITQNYLRSSRDGTPVGNQYAFCVFIAARVLLVHWRYMTENQPVEEFWSLVHSLEEMSKRWVALSEPSVDPCDLAAKYSGQLKSLYDFCSKDQSFRINVSAYTKEIDHVHVHGHNVEQRPFSQPSELHWPHGSSSLSQNMPMTIPLTHRNTLDSSRLPEISTDCQNGSRHLIDDLNSNAELGNFPPMVLDQQFMDMDRIIAFDDGSMFAATLDHGAW